MPIAGEGTWARFDYFSPDVEAAVAFYTSLFGWTSRAIDAYTMLSAGSDDIGGVVATPEGAPPAGHWFPYLATDDILAACARVVEHGGTVVRPAQDNGALGHLAIVTDPLGGSFALWQPAHAIRADYAGSAHQFVWNELSSSEPARSVAFYAAVGSYTTQTMQVDGQPYYVLERDGRARGGIMHPPAPDGAGLPMPQGWLPYVQVASTDDTIAKAKQLGASVHVAGEDVPGIGRIGIFTDPLGGMLGILQPAS